MKINLLLTVFSLVSANLHAASIQLVNVDLGIGDTIYADSSGALLSGTGVFGGYFNPDSLTFTFATSLANNDIPTLIANFNILTSAVVGAPSSILGGAYPGFFEGPNTDLGVITPIDSRIGSNLYIFAGDAATLVDSSFYSLVDLNRAIEDDVPFPVSYPLNPANGTIVIGTAGIFTGNASGQGEGTNPTVQLTAVPEPSALLLSALGILGLLRRKR